MAGHFIRKFTKWVFLSGNIICCLLFLLASLSVIVSPLQWPFIGFLSIGLPYIATALLLYIIFWLIAKPVLSIIPFVSLLIGWKQLTVILAWHPSASFKEVKSDTHLRILTWNVRGMYGISNSAYTQQRNRTEIASLVNKLGADIVCLQEFNNLAGENNQDNTNISLFTKTYPYYYYSQDFISTNGVYSSGVIIYSKYKIIEKGKIKFNGKKAESLIYTDILKGMDTIRVFTTHLQSFEFTKEDYENIEKIKDTDNEVLEASESIYSKMKRAFFLRAEQVIIVKKEMDKSPYASVICGDFNDVPNSYTYFHIRGNRQDAFLASSFGVGKSYSALAPTLRIDYILPDNQFNVNQFEMVDEGLSDHHLLLADLSMKK
jgi:endonuclease/exonuclease/phosphatase family metal-dependent hydrolase